MIGNHHVRFGKRQVPVICLSTFIKDYSCLVLKHTTIVWGEIFSLVFVFFPYNFIFQNRGDFKEMVVS